MKLSKKIELLQKRKWRIRKKVIGSSERPRLSLHFSNTNIYAQCIDDKLGVTLCATSTTSKDLKEQKLKANIESAQKLGKAFAEKANQKGIHSVVFDRGGRKYHGCVKAFADAARENGLTF